MFFFFLTKISQKYIDETAQKIVRNQIAQDRQIIIYNYSELWCIIPRSIKYVSNIQDKMLNNSLTVQPF